MNKRYSRQTQYSKFGEKSQEQLQKTHVMIIGAGALGSHCAEILVRMGVGRLTIIDMDIVEESNLHRQATYNEIDAASMLPKVEALKAHLDLINSNVKIIGLYKELTPSNIEEILRLQQPDIILDGMDHFEVRYLINETCHKLSIPWIYGAAIGSKGTVFGIDYNGPCLKCMLNTIPSTGESCSINGVLPPIIHQVASMEISELTRWVAGNGFSQKLIILDCFNLKFNTFNTGNLKNTHCPTCVSGNYELLNIPLTKNIENYCGNVFMFRFSSEIFENAEYLPLNIIKRNYFVKLAHYSNYSMTIFKDGRINIYGVETKEQANTIYNELLNYLK